jgi:serine/threonine protein kinase
MDSGKRLARYEIRSKIGEGGMGEVYWARDLKLNRIVALKILPREFAADEKRMQRFIQEAQTASALNHPNIVTVFEIDDDHEPPYIASEFIDGETLRERLGRERVNLNETIDFAIQIASALVAAHEAGIVHRDIKPENVMIRRDGIVKVLDFGVAKVIEAR